MARAIAAGAGSIDRGAARQFLDLCGAAGAVGHDGRIIIGFGRNIGLGFGTRPTVSGRRSLISTWLSDV
jgi:hypothetical protein